MKDETRRAALRYAAKTAIALSLGGCYDSHVRLWHSTPVRIDAAVPDAGAADAPPFVPPPRECDELLPSLAITDPMPDEERWHWGATFTDPAAHTDPRVGECCLALEARASEEPIVEGLIGSPLAMACCEVIVGDQHLVSSSSLGCTPWGPPCPPEMPALA